MFRREKEKIYAPQFMFKEIILPLEKSSISQVVGPHTSVAMGPAADPAVIWAGIEPCAIRKLG